MTNIHLGIPSRHAQAYSLGPYHIGTEWLNISKHCKILTVMNTITCILLIFFENSFVTAGVFIHLNKTT